MKAKVAEMAAEAMAVAEVEVEVMDEVQIEITILMKRGINSHMSRE